MAFQPDDPRIAGGQVTPPSLGDTGTVQSYEARGKGVVFSTPQTEAGFDDTIPAFLQQAMAPYVERKKNEAFVKGMTDQMRAGAQVEMLDNNGSLVDRIFGPSGYREGASFFRAHAAMASKDAELQGRMDDLKRLKPDDLNKVIGGEITGMMTGDQWTDGLIQKGMVERLGPLLNTVEKERILFQQQEAQASQVEAGVKNGGAYHGIAVSQMRLASLTEEDTQAAAVSEQNFTNVLHKPPGETDKAYRKGLGLVLNQLMDNGSFYAVEALRKRNVMDMVDPEMVTGLSAKYETYAKKALSKASEAHFDELYDLHMKQKAGTVSPKEIQAGYMQVNQALRRETGVDQDYFTPEEIQRSADGMADALVARAERNSERQQTEGEAALKASKTALAVKLAFKTGQVRTFKARGDIEESDADNYAVGLKNAGDWDQLVGAFAGINGGKMEGYSSPAVKQILQIPITASIGIGYTKDAERAYHEFTEIKKRSLATAKEYYGDQFLPMLKFDQFMQAGGGKADPAAGWKRMFGDGQDQTRIHLDGAAEKDARTALDNFLVNDLPKTFTFGERVTKSGQVGLRQLLSEDAALMHLSGGLSFDIAVKAAYQQNIASGRWEQYGKFGWKNGPGTTPLHALLGATEQDTARVLADAIEAGTNARGFHGAADWQIQRRPDGQGKGDVIITPYDNNGGHTSPIQVSVEELKRRMAAHIKAKKGFKPDTSGVTALGAGGL